jgi:serine/threonine protein kinase
LARLLYTDSSRLHIDPLHGGYSAETFRVTSYDEEGRRMRPTVLKIARRELISRESERCQQFALPYIFNNCAVVLGAEHFGEMMALRYNFVGIGGESKQLKWMTHFYQESDIPLLESLFDKVFLQILHTWYGQPVKKTIFPFKDHDPTLTFFPHIFQTVSDLFSISSDEKLIRIPESDQPILNPYWFLKHEYPARREQGMEYLTGICHGDLNMQNILLDENMNIYLIDFSETKPRSVISDFARLEAIFMIDNAPVGTETDMKDYLQFIRQFYACDRLGKVPEAAYKGREGEKVKKNVALTMKMRQYAFDSAKGDPNAIPYFIALLEWVLPVVCYTSLPEHQKRLSMIVSSILAEKVSATL